jgi:hypothetical protein
MPALNDRWRTSTRSGDNGACVEARAINDTAEVRDSKDKAGPVLAFHRVTWSEFIEGVKNGEFDL